MSLIVAIKYPQFIDEINVSEYWEEKVVNLSKIINSIILVSDSRIINNMGEYKDISQKISQLSLDLMMGYTGNVRLGEEVYKAIHFRLNEKGKMYDGLNEILNIFSETIIIKKEQLEKNSAIKHDANFFLCTVNDENQPCLYSFSHENRYSFCEELDSFACIGQNMYDQDSLIVEIKKAVLESKSVTQQLLNKELIEVTKLDLSIYIRNGFRKFVLETNKHPNRISVGGPLPAMILEPHPEGISILNEWIYNPISEVSYTMVFNNEKNRWEEKTEEELVELTVYPSESFY